MEQDSQSFFNVDCYLEKIQDRSLPIEASSDFHSSKCVLKTSPSSKICPP